MCDPKVESGGSGTTEGPPPCPDRMEGTHGMDPPGNTKDPGNIKDPGNTRLPQTTQEENAPRTCPLPLPDDITSTPSSTSPAVSTTTIPASTTPSASTTDEATPASTTPSEGGVGPPAPSEGGVGPPASSEGGVGSPAPQEATRSIQMEDSGRKFDVVEPTKPKSWLAAFNSLAPRTRQTVRTAVIALISALALVAIFHLAKLAESPASPKSLSGSTPDLLVQQDVLVQEKVYKSSSGKVVKSKNDGSDWRGGDEFERAVSAAGGDLGVVNPVQDILARAGVHPRVKIHPILGVPIAADFVEADIKRINLRARYGARPANSTEIQQTLDLVQTRVDLDRKQLTSKSLRMWAPGEAPLRIMLVTTWRSGSTFLSQVLATHPAVFHHYEPLSPQGVRQIRSGRDAFQAQQLLHRLMDCRYGSGMDDYLNYTRQHPQDMMGHNKPVWESCRHGPNTNVCYNTTFLGKACTMFPIQLVKTVRLRLNLTQLFLNDERMNVKVVFLVRDPRATMSSRYTSVSWCADKPDCSSPDVLCSDLEGDLKVATALRQLYPNAFTMLKYEDLATDPQGEIKNLMDFLGLEYSPRIAQFVKEHTEKDNNSPWSTKRKSTDRITVWKKNLPLQEIHTIQNACDSVIKTLGYELVGQ